MSSLKELQALCEASSIKFKGKTKAQLMEALKVNDVAGDATEKNNDKGKSVKELRDLCAKVGMSRLGTKLELLKRLESFENGNGNDGRKVVNWVDRGRKAATRPSETVGLDESSEDEDNIKYSDMRKDELRKQCVERNLPASGSVKVLMKRLRENDLIKDQVEKASTGISPEVPCESCKENPTKLYSIPPSKWYCHDCAEHICNLCKEAHEKLKCARTHVISPYGTLLEFNIDNDKTIIVNVDQPAQTSKDKFLDFTATDDESLEVNDNDKFLDFTATDDESLEVNNTGLKRKRCEEDEEFEEVSDLNNSYEIIYETPMAKIRYRSNKKLIVDVVPETPLATGGSCGSRSLLIQNLHESPFITPPPTFISPARRVMPSFGVVSPLEQTENVSFQQYATFVEESPDNLDKI